MKASRLRRAFGLAKRQQRAQISIDLSRLQLEFDRTQNPVFAWEAIAEAIGARLPIPAWAIQYLRVTAVEIGELSRSETPKKNQTAKAVYKALGFIRDKKDRPLKSKVGRTNPFQEMRRPAHAFGIACEVYECYTKNRDYNGAGVSWGWIYETVAKEHPDHCEDCIKISRTTVERHWRAHALEVIPPHIVKRSKSQKVDDILR